MRNLAGRLTARSVPELNRIAEFWQTVITGRDRHAVVGQLYREMREPRSARDAWDRLDDAERSLIQLLALDDERDDASRTIPELASALQWDEAVTRDVAIALYRKGILYREGDDDELPIGQMPRVFLPRELTATFRRVQDEIDAGPLQRVPLPALLALLDVNELEEAARLWGIELLPGLADRPEIEAQLVEALTDETRRSAQLRALKGDAATLWELLTSTADASASLVDLMGAAGMSGEGVALAQRRRTAAGKLEERLLAWHTYGPGQERFLFVPQRVIAEAPRTVERQASAPVAVDPDRVSPDPWIHPWSVPWDLLTLLRAVTGNEAPSLRQFDDAPTSWLDLIGGRLWNGGDRESLTSYLTFLAAIGGQENVLEGGRGGEPLTPGRSWKHWRSRSFADQYAHLIWWWNASADWIEGSGRSGIVVNNATLPQFRRKLVVLLASLERGTWYETESVARWIASIDPDILGEEVAIATAGAIDVPAGDRDWSSRATAAVVEASLRSGFTWFNLVEPGVNEQGGSLLRTTDMLRTLESTEPIGDLPAPAGSPLILRDDLTIELIDPTPLRVWSISAFADQRGFRPVPTYLITEGSLRRALDAGASLGDVRRFLEAETGTPLAEKIVATLTSWPGIEQRVQIRLVAEVVPDGANQESRLEMSLREGGWDVERRDERVSVRIDPELAQQQLRSLSSLLQQIGFQEAQRTPDSPARKDESGDA